MNKSRINNSIWILSSVLMIVMLCLGMLIPMATPVGASSTLVTQNPADLTVDAGNDAVFTAAADGSPTPTVRWQELSTDDDAAWTDISDATDTTLTLNAVTLSQNGYRYRAVFTNDSGLTMTDPAILTVVEAGNVFAWGANWNEQLGLGIAGIDSENVPVQASSLRHIVSVSASNALSLALDFNNNVWSWGNGTSTPGQGISFPQGTQIKAVSAANGEYLALDSIGKVWSWSAGSPVKMSSLNNIIAISVGGGDHSLALDSSGYVWAWGNNYMGQLGNGSTGGPWDIVTTPVKVKTITDDHLADLSKIIAIVASPSDYPYGYGNSLALDASGKVYAWGANDYGQLGLGDTEYKTSATLISGLSNIQAIAAGSGFSVAADSSGNVYAWGINSNGQLGVDPSTTTTKESNSPSQISGLSDITALSTSNGEGSGYVLALDSNGHVWAWGEAGDQLGLGATQSGIDYIATPTQIANLDGVIAISAGAGSNLAISPAFSAASTVALHSSANPSTFGSTVAFTATVSGNPQGEGTPTGMVCFEEGDNVLGSQNLNDSGQATYSTAGLPLGTNAITALYCGDTNYLPSTRNYNQTVNPFGSGTELNLGTAGRISDYFGYSVAVDGDTAIVGVPGIPATSGTGEAYIYTRSGNIWSQETELSAVVDVSAGDNFGTSVAINNGTVVVGDPGEAAWVFTGSGDNWSEQAELTSSGADNFGFSVAVNGDTAVVGDTGKDSGVADVFTRDGAGIWSLQAELSNPNENSDDSFGASAAVSGNTVVVGAPGKWQWGDRWHETQVHTGGAYVYTAGDWSQPASLSITDLTSGDNLGYSLAIDGSTIIAGDPGKDFHDDPYAGAVYIFNPSSGGWAQDFELTAADYSSDDQFGTSVAINGNTTVIGAPGKNENGAAYIFNNISGSWLQEGEPTAADGASGDQFGYSAAVSSDTVFIGAPYVDRLNQDQTITHDTGVVYIFQLQSSKFTPQLNYYEDIAYGLSNSIAGHFAEQGGMYPSGHIDLTLGGSGITRASVIDSTGNFTFPFIGDDLNKDSDLQTTGKTTIFYVYDGDANFDGINGSYPIVQINRADIKWGYVDEPNPSTTNNTVLSAYVTIKPDVNNWQDAAIPTGTVDFTEGTIPLGTATIDSSGLVGTVIITITNLTVGNHFIDAKYSGDEYYQSSIYSMNQTVLYPTSISIGSGLSNNTAVYGQPVRFTASVSSSGGIPDGYVYFDIDDATSLVIAALDSSGSATTDEFTLAVGSHTVTADYHGEGNFQSCSTMFPLTFSVTAATTSPTIATTSTSASPPVIYAITANAGGGGGISPSGSAAVVATGGQTFTITPNTGYEIASINVDGSSVGAVTSYMFTNVVANHTISATFKIRTFTVTATGGTGGTITLSGAVTVPYGADQTFTISPATGYQVANIEIDGSSQGAVTSYTFHNLIADHTIDASFSLIPVTSTTETAITTTGSTTVTSTTTTSTPPATTTVTGTAAVETSQDVLLESADQNATVNISAGTEVTDANGQPIAGEITVTELSVPPAGAPAGENIVSVPYEFEPSGAHFNPPLIMTFNYNAGVTNPVVAYYSVSEGRWITVGGVVDPINHTITVQVDHFTTFAVLGQLAVNTTTSTPIPTTASATTQTTTPTTTQTITTTTPIQTTTTTIMTTTTTPGAPWWLWTIIGVVVILIILGISILVRRRRNA